MRDLDHVQVPGAVHQRRPADDGGDREAIEIKVGEYAGDVFATSRIGLQNFRAETLVHAAVGRRAHHRDGVQAGAASKLRNAIAGIGIGANNKY